MDNLMNLGLKLSHLVWEFTWNISVISLVMLRTVFDEQTKASPPANFD